MDASAQILDVVAFFRNAFSLIFALALAEAFKQFVFDRAKPTDAVIDWGRLVPLLAFVLLIFPFYQGTVRYFDFAYGDPNNLPPHYSISLMIDGCAFICEAALFFIMSRALAPTHWTTYYGAVMTLLWVDSLWGWTAAILHAAPIDPWIILNLIFGAAVAVMLWLRSHLSPAVATAIGAAAVLVRTGLDYYFTWSFYFP